MSAPIRFTIAATAAQIAAVRLKLGVPATAKLGKITANKDVTIDWRVTPAGVAIVATPKSFRALVSAQVDPGEIEAQIRQQFGA